MNPHEQDQYPLLQNDLQCNQLVLIYFRLDDHIQVLLNTLLSRIIFLGNLSFFELG